MGDGEREVIMWHLTVTLAGNGNKTVRKYALNVEDFTGAMSAKDEIVSALQNVTSAVVQKATITYTENMSNTFAAAGVQVENIASISARTLNDNPVVISIPAPRDELFIGAFGDAANVVDVTSPELTQYRDALANFAYVSDGEQISQLISGKRIHRKSRKG